MLIHYKKLLILLVTRVIFLESFAALPLSFLECAVLSVSRNICHNSVTWFFSPCCLLNETAAFCWGLIQTHWQWLCIFFMCVSQVPVLWHSTVSFQLIKFLFSLSLWSSFMGYRARALPKFLLWIWVFNSSTASYCCYY